ncbi:uncharacterized protein G2W53_002932 [Senna tora]|uniref:Uncharacterized protein n=1 Tax=Senna tora TaxID=362788 RepID=A0A834XAR5_9FABA|nr:uncharacterized protein G2W53_002932 [Senna tora]
MNLFRLHRFMLRRCGHLVEYDIRVLWLIMNLFRLPGFRFRRCGNLVEYDIRVLWLFMNLFRLHLFGFGFCSYRHLIETIQFSVHLESVLSTCGENYQPVDHSEVPYPPFQPLQEWKCCSLEFLPQVAQQKQIDSQVKLRFQKNRNGKFFPFKHLKMWSHIIFWSNRYPAPKEPSMTPVTTLPSISLPALPALPVVASAWLELMILSEPCLIVRQTSLEHDNIFMLTNSAPTVSLALINPHWIQFSKEEETEQDELPSTETLFPKTTTSFENGKSAVASVSLSLRSLRADRLLRMRLTPEKSVQMPVEPKRPFLKISMRHRFDFLLGLSARAFLLPLLLECLGCEISRE